MKTLIAAAEPAAERSVFCRCTCTDAATGKRLGALCPQLGRPGHGSWYFAVEAPTEIGRRNRLRRGGYPTREHAHAARAELLAEPRGLAAGHAWTLERWLRHWLQDNRHHLRPTTWDGYRKHIDTYLVPMLGRHTLADLTTRQIQATLRVIATRRTTGGDLIAAGTVVRILATLRSALSAAVRAGFITISPAAAARPPRPAAPHAVLWTKRRERDWRLDSVRPRVAVWDTRHVTEFFDHVRDERTFALWWVALLCGLRRGELAGLRWRDIDLEEHTLDVVQQTLCIAGKTHHLPPKSMTSRRTVTLDDATIAVLQHHRDRQEQESFGWREDSRGHVFTCIDGAPMKPSTMSHQFLNAVRASGLPPIRLHDLRHGAATMAFAAEADLKYVQQRLGHSSPVTTAAIYISVLSDIENRQAQATARMILDAARRRPEPGGAQA